METMTRMSNACGNKDVMVQYNLAVHSSKESRPDSDTIVVADMRAWPRQRENELGDSAGDE